MRAGYCLRSNETGWDEATLRRTYFTLTDLEAVFRSLNSELGLRPIYHHKPTRAEAPQQAIYDALGVDSAPGGIRKSIV